MRRRGGEAGGQGGGDQWLYSPAHAGDDSVADGAALEVHGPATEAKDSLR